MHKSEIIATKGGFSVLNGTTKTEVINQDGSINATLALDAGSVTLAKLAAGITSSHVIKYARLGAGLTTTAMPGLVVADLVIRITTAGACTCKPVATADTLPDDPADTDYLIVLRAAA